MRSRLFVSPSSGMRRGLLGLGLLVLVLVGAGGPAARGASLRWKFKPGETLRYSMEQKTVAMTSLPGGQELKTSLIQTIEMTWAVKGVDDGGHGAIVQTIDRIRDQVEAPVGSFVYDSKEAKEPEGVIAAARVPVIKTLLGAPIAFKMSPLGVPGDVRVPEGLAKALRDLGPSGQDPGALFSEEGLKELIAQSSLILPQDDLAEGESWTRQVKNPVPKLGTMVHDSTFRYEGPAPGAGPGAVRIGLATKIGLLPAADADSNGLKIRSQTSRGSYTFDNAAGHILDANLSEVIEVGATLKVGLGTQAREMELTQSTDITTIRKLVGSGKNPDNAGENEK